jgi:hypothetical protein
MSDPSDERTVTFAPGPGDRALLRSERHKDMVRVIFDRVVIDRLAFGPALRARLDVDVRHAIFLQRHPARAAARGARRPSCRDIGLFWDRHRASSCMRFRTPNSRHRLGRRAPPRERACALRGRSDNLARTSCVFSPPRTTGLFRADAAHRTGQPPRRRRIRINIILVPNNLGKVSVSAGRRGTAVYQAPDGRR